MIITNRNIKKITKSAIIAAAYIVMTFVATMLGLSNGIIQLRFSEILCILPIYTVTAVPGLAIGCLISNIVSGASILDMIFGTTATLLGAIGTRLLRKKKPLAILCPIISNTLIIPFVLYFGYQIKQPYILLTGAILAGEGITSGIFGTLLAKVIDKNSKLKSELQND